MCKLLNINNLQGLEGSPDALESGGGATLKIFFAYFSASGSYGFCDFQNKAYMVHTNVNCLNS